MQNSNEELNQLNKQINTMTHDEKIHGFIKEFNDLGFEYKKKAFHELLETYETHENTFDLATVLLENSDEQFKKYVTEDFKIMNDILFRFAIYLYFEKRTIYDNIVKVPVGEWNVKYVKNMVNAFYGKTGFNENLSKWNTDYVEYMNGIFDGCDSKSIIIILLYTM